MVLGGNMATFLLKYGMQMQRNDWAVCLVFYRLT